MSENSSDSDLFVKICAWLIGTLVAVPIVFIVIGVFWLYGVAVYGYIGAKLWAWFVVSTFGVKPITFLQAAGLIMVGKIFVPRFFWYSSKDAKKDNTDIFYNVLGSFIAPWVALFFAYILKIWIGQ
jgi:hypothetical protein